MRSSGGPYQLVMEHSYSLSSALLLEVSAVARQIWTDQYPQYRFQKTKCDQLAAAMVLRECWLQKSHEETARLFYQLGWKPLDVILAWLIGDYTTFGESIDPACAAEVAREDPETAVWILDPDHSGLFHRPVPFLLRLRDGPGVDHLPLLLLRLDGLRAAGKGTPAEKDERPLPSDPGALPHAGLGPPGAGEGAAKDRPSDIRNAPDWSSPKLAKAQRLALTKAPHPRLRGADTLRWRQKRLGVQQRRRDGPRRGLLPAGGDALWGLPPSAGRRFAGRTSSPVRVHGGSRLQAAGGIEMMEINERQGFEALPFRFYSHLWTLFLPAQDMCC